MKRYLLLISICLLLTSCKPSQQSIQRVHVVSSFLCKSSIGYALDLSVEYKENILKNVCHDEILDFITSDSFPNMRLDSGIYDTLNKVTVEVCIPNGEPYSFQYIKGYDF